MMKIEAGKTYLTKDGRKVKVVATIESDVEFPILAKLETHAVPGEDFVLYSKEGKVRNRNLKDMDIKEEFLTWLNVDVDTPILVSDDGKNWKRAHFKEYIDGDIFAFANGKTSWTATECEFTHWAYAKLKN